MATYRRNAQELLGSADAARLELDDLPTDFDDVRGWQRRAQLEREIAHDLAAAQVNATLEVASAFREWTSVGREGLDAAERPPAVLVSLPSKKDEDEQQ